MKAIMLQKPGQVVICDIPKPKRRPGEALLKTLYGGICGSDLNAYRGAMAYFSYPRVPGHEFCARIEEIEPNAQGFHVGDVVICNPYFNCGQCYTCRRQAVNACMHNQTMGVQRDGAFAEYITMPIARLIHGRNLPPKMLALVEPLCIGLHGIQRANVTASDRVLVMGAGAIGLSAAIAAKARGAAVYIADIAPKKLEYGLDFCLDGVILNDDKAHFDREILRLTQGEGFDVTVEAVGMPSTFQDCLDAVAYSGRVVVIGIGKHNVDLDFTVIQKKELHVFGARNALTADFEGLLDVLAGQDLRIDRLITHTYPLEQADRAFADFDRDVGNMLKVMIDFTG